MIEMRERHPEWIWNRSDTHVFLGPPGTHEAFKTPVEPGNSFSPGVGTYGVSTWVFTGGCLHAPQEKALEELNWGFADGCLPVLVSRWRAGDIDVCSRLFSESDGGPKDVKDYLRVELRNCCAHVREATLYLVLRSFGAAGGPVNWIACGNGVISVNGGDVAYCGKAPDAFGALSYQESGQDISVLLRRGEMPSSQAVEDPSTWASCAAAYRVELMPHESSAFDFVFHLHAEFWMLDWLRPPARPIDCAARESEFIERERAARTVNLDLPDRRFVDAFGCQLTHLRSFIVHGAPRISPVTYPQWWIRDNAYEVVALDRGGFHDEAAAACWLAVRDDPMTGFGAEGDAPGELIWMLSEHYLTTRDLGFLEEVYPFMERKADLIVAMRNAREPMLMHYEFATSECGLDPGVDILCRPSRDGLVEGRMDHHFPTYWCSAFGFLGLKRMAQCARELELDGSRYADEAQSLLAAMKRNAPELFGRNERDFTSSLWPTEWADPNDPVIRAAYDRWWNAERMPEGRHSPERLWTYFEAGQAHNYMLLGSRDRMWVSLDHFLCVHAAPGLYAWHEGEKDENSTLMLWDRTRGWDRRSFVVPTGWTSAEVFLLLRNCLVHEDGDSLLLGAGVPEAWMTEPFSAAGLPTHFGRASFRYEPSSSVCRVAMGRPPAGGVISRFPGAVSIELD
jgi:hypothetical protein